MFSTPAAYRTLEEEESPRNLRAKLRLLTDAGPLFSVYRLTHHPDTAFAAEVYRECAVWLKSSDEHLRQGMENLAVLDSGAYSVEQEHLLSYLVFRHMMDAIKHKSLFQTAAYVVAVNQFQRFFTAFRSGGKDRAIPALNDRILSVSWLSRIFEHNDVFRERFFQLLRDGGYENLETMYQLIS